MYFNSSIQILWTPIKSLSTMHTTGQDLAAAWPFAKVINTQKIYCMGLLAERPGHLNLAITVLEITEERCTIGLDGLRDDVASNGLHKSNSTHQSHLCV